MNEAFKMANDHVAMGMRSSDEAILWTIISVTFLHKQSDETFKAKI